MQKMEEISELCVHVHECVGGRIGEHSATTRTVCESLIDPFTDSVLSGSYKHTLNALLESTSGISPYMQDLNIYRGYVRSVTPTTSAPKTGYPLELEQNFFSYLILFLFVCLFLVHLPGVSYTNHQFVPQAAKYHNH